MKSPVLVGMVMGALGLAALAALAQGQARRPIRYDVTSNLADTPRRPVETYFHDARNAAPFFEWLGPWDLIQQDGVVALLNPWADDLAVWTVEPGFSGCWASYTRQFRVSRSTMVTVTASVVGITGAQEYDRAWIFLAEDGLSIPALRAEFSYQGWPPQFGSDMQSTTFWVSPGTYVVRGEVGAQWSIFGWPVHAELHEGRLHLDVALLGDFDGDGDVDLDDFGSFAACYNGAANPPAATCPPGVDADFDCDGDVDLDDFGTFAANYTGAE